MSTRLIIAVLMASSSVLAQDTALADKRIPFSAIPYMVDTSGGPRGTQQGYNISNSPRKDPTRYFCIWAPSKPDSSIANTEGELVTWCTKPGHGSRIIPAGALTGVQVIQTPDYVQVTGRVNQSMINILHGDSGGEEGSHGADGRGNPLGGIAYSNAYPSSNGNNASYVQVIEWHNFFGADTFCFKGCDPAGKKAANLCQHIYDRIGCAYNAPAAYQDGVFLSCKSENQDPSGVYTGSDGQVSTYMQPAESLGPISTMPYQPKIPASSECVTFSSAELYAAAASIAPNPNQPSTTAKPSTTSRAASGSATKTSSTSSPTSGAQKHVIDMMTGLLGPLVAILVVIA